MSSLTSIAASVNSCSKCPLYKGVTHHVPGYGSEHAEILFVGEGPGKNEDLQGKPFVGAAGKFLDTMLESIGLSRDAVFITNIVKCRPPDNRDPRDDEIAACLPHLEEQINALQPKLIVTLGRYSMGYFLPGVTISGVHGQPKKRKSDGRVILPLYHPAVALYNGGMRKVLLEDFSKITKVLSKIAG